MQGLRRHLYTQRLTRDIADVLSHDFTSSSAVVKVYPPPDGNVHEGLLLSICILEGPYRGGHFTFVMEIPDNYPFRGVDIWSKNPVWHPNIDIRSGKVALPLAWSPVLSLLSVAVSMQMIMLEPSSDTPLNLESCSYYCSDPKIFDSYAQRTLHGCTVDGILLPNMFAFQCNNCSDDTSVRSSASTSPTRTIGKYSDDNNLHEMTISSEHSTKFNTPSKKRAYSNSIESVDLNESVSRRLAMLSNPGGSGSDGYEMNDSPFHNDDENYDFLQRFKRMKYDEVVG